MKTLHLAIIVTFVFIALTIVMTDAFAQNDTSTYTPPNDLGDGNIFTMVANGPFLPGQLVEINGNLITINSIHIVLDDPNGQIATSKTTFSDRDGYFTSELKIPSDAIAGIWKIVGTSGIYHKELNFTIAGNSDVVTCYGGDLCSKPIANTTVQYGPKLVASTAIRSPLQQFKSGIAAEDVKCGQGLQLVIRAEDNSPACVKADTAIVLVNHRWAMNVLQPNPMTGLNNDTGIATLKNQAYYFETANYTDDAYNHPVQISFHDVIFTLFPSGFRGGLPAWGCGGSYYWADAKFSDGTSELLQIFVGDQQCFVPQPVTHFSNHTNPQAGLTFYDGRMKLLVSVNNPVSSSTNYTKESKVTGDVTYLSQTVDEWKSKTPEQLKPYYEKYKDAFYDELGSFLIKDEMKKELARQKIQNVYDDFKVFPGMSLDSLPPHISYDAVVNATDGNSYLLLGDVFANKIESSPKIIKLVFDKNALHSLNTGNGPSYPDPSTNAHVNNSTSQEKVQIAGTYIENSDIPWSSVGTGNYGVIQIGLYTSVYHMIPDAQKYYTARAMQLIPFYVPVKILPPPSTAK